MLDRWLRRAGVDVGSVALQSSQGERIFDVSRWEPHDGTAEGRRRRRGKSRRARAQRLALLGVALIFICATALLLLPGESDASPEGQAPAGEAAAPGSEKPAWLPVVRPLRLFALEAPELIKAAQNYDAIRSTRGDGREDNISFGSAARIDALFMRVSIYRSGSEVAEPAPFFVDLSRRAASLGLAVAKTTPGEAMHTKFGEMEASEIKLSMSDVERRCIAFRRAVPGESLRITGWYCAPAGGFAGRAGLSCLLDRLALLSAGEDHALRDSFVAAEKRRPAACSKGPLIAATSGNAPLPPAIAPAKLRGAKPR